MTIYLYEYVHKQIATDGKTIFILIDKVMFMVPTDPNIPLTTSTYLEW